MNEIFSTNFKNGKAIGFEIQLKEEDINTMKAFAQKARDSGNFDEVHEIAITLNGETFKYASFEDLLVVLRNGGQSAAQFGFVLFTDDDNQVLVLVAPKDDPDFDQHISAQIQRFWPSDMILDEVEEGSFLISEELTEDEVKAKLLAAGFVHDEEWQTELNAQLAENNF